MNGNEDLQEWQDCPTGELTQMVRRLDTRERRGRVRQLASTGLLSLLLFTAGMILFGGFAVYEEPTFGGISCSDCLSHAAAYHDHVAGAVAMSDPELAGKIESHLKQCVCCRVKFHQAYPDVPMAELVDASLQFRSPLPTLAVAIGPALY